MKNGDVVGNDEAIVELIKYTGWRKWKILPILTQDVQNIDLGDTQTRYTQFTEIL